MRLLLFPLIFALFLQADEMQRIESIVNDITKLRVDYEECKNELKVKHPDVIKSCSKEQKQIKKFRKLLSDEKKINNELYDSLKLLDKKYKNILKSKDNEIINLKNKIKNINKKSSVRKVKFDNPNKFPKLMMKSEYKKSNLQDSKLEYFKAKSFRLKVNSDIFNSFNGRKIDKWEKDSSFTSNTKNGKWIKITGYFVKQKWKKANKNLWIKENNIVQK